MGGYENMILNIIRHAQSLANVGVAKTPDDGLSELGKEQATLLGEYYKGKRVTHIFSSPFTRVIQTVTPTALTVNLPVVLIPELSEIFDSEHRRDHPFDSCEKLEELYPFARFTTHHDPNQKWWPDWPETEEKEVRERVVSFYQRELNPLLGTNAHVLVFGHGATTGELRRQVQPNASKELPGNAVIFECELDENGICLDHRLLNLEGENFNAN